MLYGTFYIYSVVLRVFFLVLTLCLMAFRSAKESKNNENPLQKSTETYGYGTENKLAILSFPLRGTAFGVVWRTALFVRLAGGATQRDGEQAAVASAAH